MFKSFAALAFAGLASANEPSLIESKMNHFSEDVPNDKYDVVIDQVSGDANWTMISRGTYGDPDPVCKNCTEKFVVYGVWNIDNADLAKVNFTCYLLGAEAYSQDYSCTGEGNDYGNCPPATGKDQDWTADFGFDVPSIAPPFQYDVQITAYTSTGAELWKLESKFYIP